MGLCISLLESPEGKTKPRFQFFFHKIPLTLQETYYQQSEPCRSSNLLKVQNHSSSSLLKIISLD